MAASAPCSRCGHPRASNTRARACLQPRFPGRIAFSRIASGHRARRTGVRRQTPLPQLGSRLVRVRSCESCRVLLWPSSEHSRCDRARRRIVPGHVRSRGRQRSPPARRSSPAPFARRETAGLRDQVSPARGGGPKSMGFPSDLFDRGCGRWVSRRARASSSPDRLSAASFRPAFAPSARELPPRHFRSGWRTSPRVPEACRTG